MKFRKESYTNRRERRKGYLSSWHKWFAWRPVRVNDEEIAWLEYVERRGHCYTGADVIPGSKIVVPVEKWWWEYREREIV